MTKFFVVSQNEAGSCRFSWLGAESDDAAYEKHLAAFPEHTILRVEVFDAVAADFREIDNMSFGELERDWREASGFESGDVERKN